MPCAALLVHQLRFELAFGGDAGARLAQQGHAYLHSLTPWIVAALALAAGAFVHALGRALSGQRSRSGTAGSFATLWFACSACLVAIYAGQELTEGFFATGHPAGLAGVFGYGGWWCIPSAACVGLVLAAIFNGATRALDAVSSRRAATTTWAADAERQRRRWTDVPAPRLSALAAGWSGRGPPGLTLCRAAPRRIPQISH